METIALIYKLHIEKELSAEKCYILVLMPPTPDAHVHLWAEL